MNVFSKYYSRLTKPSIYAKSAFGEWLKFIIGTIVATIITSFILSYVKDNVSNFFNQDTLFFLIALLLGASISFLFFSIFIYYENSEAFMYLHRVRTKGRDIFNKNQKKIFNFIKTEYNTLLTEIVKLPNEQVKSTYTNQIRIASIFNNLAENRFWATSFDLPSKFYAKNKDYFSSMDNLLNITGMNNDIPSKSRVFICSLDEFIEDIYHNPQSLTNLIKWHLYWHKKDDIGNVNSPIRFYLYDDKSKLEVQNNFFKDIKNENIIQDFMIVDNKLVYGRLESKSIEDNKVTLKAITTKEVKPLLSFSKLKPDVESQELIEKYDLIFTKIYNSSLEPLEIIDLLSYDIDKFKERMIEIDNDLIIRENVPFSSQSYKLEESIITGIKKIIKIELTTIINDYNSIQDKDKRYNILFENAYKGNSFTSKWLELMVDSSDICIAVDNADSRNGKTRFLDKWTDDPLYADFLNSSAKAVRNKKAKFKRVFILDEKINEKYELKFHSFIKDCVTTFGLEIGVVLLSDLLEKNIVTEETIQTKTDFILLRIKQNKNNKLNLDNALGFKISKYNTFNRASLSYYDNLINPNEINTYYSLFKEIYAEATIFSTDVDVNRKDKLDKFINR